MEDDSLDDGFNVKKYIPHKLKFSKKEADIRNTYIYSAIYLLSNIDFYMNYFLSLNKNELSDFALKFYYMINNIFRAMEGKLDDDDLIKSVEEFMISYVDVERDPRIFIKQLFTRVIKLIPKLSNYTIKDGIKTEIDMSGNSSLERSIQESIYLLEDFNEDNINDITNNIIIKLTTKNNTKYFGLFTISFTLGDTKKYTLEDCFINYLSKVKDNASFNNSYSSSDFLEEKMYIQFPESIIILIYFGNEDKDFYKCCYDFNKILDFTKLIKDGKVNKDIKYKKYFLSGLIACKFPKNKEKEFYYTFARKDEKNEKFTMYNCKEYDKIEKRIIISDNESVDNKIKKTEKIPKETVSTTSYPYVLIYTAIKEN